MAWLLRRLRLRAKSFLPAVTLFVMLGYSAGVVHAMWRSPGRFADQVAWLLALYSLLAALAMFSFLRSCLTFEPLVPAELRVPFSHACRRSQPGDTANSWSASLAYMAQIASFRDSKLNGCRRYCYRCKHYKPDRTHHCSECQRCVLKMDHHCAFTDNCIGHHNYKYFFLFLLYAAAAASLGTFCLLRAHSATGWSVRALIHRQIPPTVPGLFLFGLMMAFVALGFLLFHLFLAGANYTTLEYLEHTNRVRNGKAYRHTFTGPVLYNFWSVFGSNPLFWLLPTARGVPGNGMWFERFE